MGLFSSGPSFSERTKQLAEIVENGSNDAKRRDALEKIARENNGDVALGMFVDNDSLEDFIRMEAIEHLEYARAEDVLLDIVDARVEDKYKLEAIEALASMNADDSLAKIARHFDGENEQLSRKAFEYL